MSAVYRYHRLVMKSKLLVVSALAIVCWAAPSQADIVYTVNMEQYGHQPAPRANVIGTITTDGTIGALQPNNILSWQLTGTLTNWTFNYLISQITSSGSGGEAFSWTPESFSATPTELIFDSLHYSASLSFPFVQFYPVYCGGMSGVCGERRINTTTQFYSDTAGGSVFTIGFNGTPSPAAVPGPIAGAGVPGLIAACAGLIAWRRRRKTATAHQTIARCDR